MLWGSRHPWQHREKPEWHGKVPLPKEKCRPVLRLERSRTCIRTSLEVRKIKESKISRTSVDLVDEILKFSTFT